MEARMKLIRWAAMFVAMVAILLSGVGCQEKTSTGGNDGTSGEVGSIQIVTGTTNDTLAFLPNDSASTSVVVIVTDTRGLALPGKKVDITLANPNLGVIEFLDTELLDTTNSLGRVNCMFRVYSQAGNQIISASSGGISTNRTLVIREADQEINSVTMIVTPENIEASELEDDSARVDVRIVDSGNRGVPNVALNLTATGGLLVQPPVTDASGRTTTWWFNNRQFGEFTIFVRAGSLRDSAIVTVAQVPRELGTLRVATDSRLVEADGCITAANITATLKNVFGEAVRGDTIRFGAPVLGAVQPYAITDSLGVATVNFCGMSIPNDQDPIDSSMVVARYERWGLRDTVNIRIVPAAGIGDINLSAPATSGIAGRDSIQLNLNVFFANGTRVNGYYAKFRVTQCGSFKYDSTRLVDGRPDSANFYYLCTAIPQSPPEITVEVDGVVSEPLTININPGDPSYVFLFALPQVGIGDVVDVRAAVADTFGNPVRAGEVVNFTTTLGTITPYVNTDETGIATANLATGNSSGIGIVQARLISGVDSAVTTLIVTSGSANRVVTTLNPPSLLARGSGGQDWSQIQAEAYDANGNPVEDGTWVTFEIGPNAPAGVNINNRGSLDSSQTSNGVAVATLNAGTGTGPVSVVACVRVAGGQQACSPVTGSVVAGPPAEIDLGLDEVGEDAGGAAWDVEISALVKDAVQNNVINGTAVFFEVEPVELAQILSEAVVVGNENADGDVRPGVAFTTLRYNSLATNSLVTVSARTANGIVATQDFILPIQEPTIVVNCLPGSWHFVANGNPCRIELQATVRDGHQVLINGQQVYYAANRGRMWPNPQIQGQPISMDFTGPEFGEPDGQCSIFLCDSVNFIFPDALTPEIPGEVRVEVVGYQDATDSQVINFRR